MSKKIIVIISLILCLVFAGGCFGNTTVQTKKEITTIAELMESDGYEKNISLASFASVKYEEAVIAEAQIKARAAKDKNSFSEADFCEAGDKINIDFVCTFTAGAADPKQTTDSVSTTVAIAPIELERTTDFDLILGEGKLASEIEDAIINAKLQKGSTTELEVVEKLDYYLSTPVERNLKFTVTVNSIGRCALTEEEMKAAEAKLKEAKEKDIAWDNFVSKCIVSNQKDTIIDAYKSAKRKSDANFAMGYGKNVTITDLTGISSSDYESSLNSYALRKYNNDFIYEVMIKKYSKECALTDEEKKTAYSDYSAMLGIDNDLSESTKAQIDDQLKRDKIKDFVYNSIKPAV